VLPLLNQMLGVTTEDWLLFGTVDGMRRLLDSGDRRIPSICVKAMQNFDPSFDLETLLSRMEKAEAEGNVGQKTRGTYVTALDRALGGGAPEYMTKLGNSVHGKPIAFNTEVEFEFQPVDSQRMLQWAARFGKQEEVVSALANLHFEKQQSVTNRSTLMEVVDKVGLDQQAFQRFLDSDELVADIWKSYGDTIQKGIHSIPFFIFNGPLTNGGCFRDGSNTAVEVHGSANANEFASAFEKVYFKNRKSLAALEAPITVPNKESSGERQQRAAQKSGSPKKGLKKGFLL